MRTDVVGSEVADVVVALDELAAADVAGAADEVITAEVVALVAAGHRLHAQVARRVEVLDRRGLARLDGFRTARAWLQALTRMSGVAAHRLVTQARLLARLPRVAAATAAGEVSAEHVGQVARLVHQLRGVEAAGGDPVGVVAEADQILAEAATALDVGSFGRVCDRVRAHVDPDGPDPAGVFAARGLTLTPTGQAGGTALRGQLDPEGGATLATALDAVMTPPVNGDERTAAQRRADALVELARRSLLTGELPTVGGQRPQVGVLLHPQALSPALLDRLAAAHRGTPAGHRFAHYATRASRTDGVSPAGRYQADRDSAAGNPAASNPAGGAAGQRRWWETAHWTDPPLLDHIGHIPPTVAQRIACDADIWRLILDPTTGAPLDVGRSHRLVPPWIRKALHARDRGCRFPGCHTPAPWTDAHHLTPWAEGGETNVDGCVLLCRHHHGLVHEGGWTITVAPATGQVSVTRPDGTLHALSGHYRPGHFRPGHFRPGHFRPGHFRPSPREGPTTRAA